MKSFKKVQLLFQTLPFILYYLYHSTGRSYVITSQKILMQSLESIAQKIQPGVVIQFEKIGPDPEPINREGSILFIFLT